MRVSGVEDWWGVSHGRGWGSVYIFELGLSVCMCGVYWRWGLYVVQVGVGRVVPYYGVLFYIFLTLKSVSNCFNCS